ncbi:alpha/beta fold hydrolase [Candidatus Curtissbacteria bacterium]|nr:alpha/beta fold hydrolase [Candidatus Curtissbacteria bacterium]
MLAGLFFAKWLPLQKAAGSVTDKVTTALHPLSIEKLRQGNYPGSDLVIEQTLEPGTNYNRYIASYKSEGLKIYCLLTVPTTAAPTGGYPAIIFNHGYIPPQQNRTTERYVAYVDNFARNGYVVFKSDYRGHGDSEGDATGAYGSTGYTIDVLNALAAIKKYPVVNSDKIGMWGHSLGGYLTLRAMVVSRDIRVGVIWGGVVGSYEDLLYNWRRSTPAPSGTFRSSLSWRKSLLDTYGDPAKNPTFWNSISATSYLADISGPLQLHHATTDTEVPVEFSRKLASLLKTAGKTVELYEYEGDDHNISANFATAMQRSVAFFDKYLK